MARLRRSVLMHSTFTCSLLIRHREGAPSFVVFAKGGYNEHLREWLGLIELICIEECT